MMRSTIGSSLMFRFLVPLLVLALLPSSAGAQGAQGTQSGGNGRSSAAAADTAKACPEGAPCEQEAAASPADSKKTDKEEPGGELVGVARNESAVHLGQAFRYGIEGFRQGDGAKVEVALELIHEQYGRIPIVDEARLAVSVPRTMFGREVELGVSLWRDLTIDARSRVVGPELLLQLPRGLEFTTGAYIGNINIEEAWGRFVMARAQVERAFGGLELLVNFELGRIHSAGDTRRLGEGVFKMYEVGGVIPMTLIPGLRRIPGSIAISIEKKQTTFGGDGPDDREITKIFGYEFPLTAVATKIGQALSRARSGQ